MAEVVDMGRPDGGAEATQKLIDAIKKDEPMMLPTSKVGPGPRFQGGFGISGVGAVKNPGRRGILKIGRLK